MEIRPDYYNRFKCIADKCKHSCCIGWEIDIDDETIEKYKNETGDLKKLLDSNVSLSPCPHFILGKDERCPFLNEKNLCHLILQRGEDILCEICREHPRFYFQTDYGTEMGIGLCCEEAARLILTSSSPMKLISDSGELPETDFFRLREYIFSILQNREISLNERITSLLEWAEVLSPEKATDWVEFYKKLERLDGAWDDYLNSITRISDEIPENLEICSEQLICYFIYRHLNRDLSIYSFSERIQFAILSCYIINSLNKSNTVEEMLEIARMYSSEIEYSDENVYFILDKLLDFNDGLC